MPEAMLALTMPSVETMKVRTQCHIEINYTYKKNNLCSQTSDSSVA